MIELAIEILTVDIPKKCPVPRPQLQYLLWSAPLAVPNPCGQLYYY